jgi:hypothetical protein
MIAIMRNYLLKKGYSVVIDSTAPDNITRAFLLATKVQNVNRLVVLFDVEREVMINRNIAFFGSESPVLAWDARWETPLGGVPLFKFKSNNMKEFEAYYARLKELLESEIHPYKPEFHPLAPFKEIIKSLKNFLKKQP